MAGGSFADGVPQRPIIRLFFHGPFIQRVGKPALLCHAAIQTLFEQGLAEGWVERTIPEKPKSRLQKYRLTEKGRAALADMDEKA